LETRGRSRSHVENVRSHARTKIGPFFKEMRVDVVSERDLERFMGLAGASPLEHHPTVG